MKATQKLMILMIQVFVVFSLSAQSPERVEPPFWWAGMKSADLQLMVYDDNISSLGVQVSDYEGLELRQVTRLQSPNYLIVDLRMSPSIQPGIFTINFNRGKRTVYSYRYELKERSAGSAERVGFNTSDVMYLITPDRFANGNPENDTMDGMKEAANRDFQGGRHGGDIKGILENLDYIDDMGFTAIWVNPVLENDMAEYSYHGYSTTDFYKVDSRFGTNEEYRQLSLKAKEKGIKMIMDMIVNHAGSDHWWMKDLPASDWVNYQDEYLNGEYQITSHKKATIQDPYRAQIDLKEFADGWFVSTMPDLNQRNPYVATYLTQNAIWWIEYAALDGIRMDTYPYPDKDYMTEWTCAVMNEYPDFNVVGEEWNNNQNIVAHWQRGKENPNGYTSCLRSLMDFPLQNMMVKGLTGPNEYYDDFTPQVKRFGGIGLIYETLALDFVYADPSEFVVFPDNHDMSRFFTQVREDYDLFKLGNTLVLTTRGVPQIYYGTEILMKNPGTDDHGIIRSDFPGGWAGDEINAFSGEGLTNQQKDAQQFFKTLLKWRKNTPVIHSGRLMHYAPKDDVYVYFRYDNTDKVMVILNKNQNDVTLYLDRFSEMLEKPMNGVEIISGRSVTLHETLVAPAMSPMVIDLN